jgi:hypothetical protein
VQPASVTTESNANAQIALRALRPENLHIPNVASARIPNSPIQAGLEGSLGQEAGVEAKTPALVVIVTVVEAELFAAGVSGLCVKVHIESPGSEAQFSATPDAKPSTELTVMVAVTVPCVPTVAVDGVALIVKSGPVATPVPESATV